MSSISSSWPAWWSRAARHKEARDGKDPFRPESSTSFPAVDEKAVDALLRQEIAADATKFIVLDDDPTGVQTVHDISVYTDWSVESIKSGLLEENKVFYILTNSRGLTAEETTAVHREILRQHHGSGPGDRRALPHHEPQRLHPPGPLPP